MIQFFEDRKVKVKLEEKQAKPPQKPALVSFAEYARYRKCHPSDVHQARQDGRLVNCVVSEPRGKITRWWVTDVVAADAEWEANTRPKLPSVAPGDDEDPESPTRNAPGPYRKARGELAIAQAKKAQADAEIAQINLELRRGQVIEIEEARRQVEAVIVASKTHIRAIPRQFAQEHPELPAAIIKAMAEKLDAALAELADIEL